MFGVLFAERAVLGHYQSVGIVALVLVAIVVSVLSVHSKVILALVDAFIVENSVQKNYTPLGSVK